VVEFIAVPPPFNHAPEQAYSLQTPGRGGPAGYPGHALQKTWFPEQFWMDGGQFAGGYSPITLPFQPAWSGLW
jgi:hypothetical protein